MWCRERAVQTSGMRHVPCHQTGEGGPHEYLFHPPCRPLPSQPINFSFSLPLPHRVPSAGRSCETPRAPHYARMSLQQVLRTIKRNRTQNPCSWAATPASAACYLRSVDGKSIERERERRLLLSLAKAEVDSLHKTCISQTFSAPCPEEKKVLKYKEEEE